MRARSLTLFIPAILLLGLTWLATAALAAPAPKVDVCHVPPGNPANFHTITVSENALPAHLDHDDLLGACSALCATLCDDSNACTIDDTGDCETAGCPTTRDQVDCNDGNTCTADSCDPATGCENTPLPGNACTVDDTDPCTEPSGVCDEEGACTSIPVPGCCNTTDECTAVDEDRCTIEECIANACQTVDQVDCSIDACNVSVCDPATGDCTPPEPVVCGELPCHVNGCDPDTGCFSNLIPGCCVDDAECDDGNNCTTDVCNGVAGCSNERCAAGDACNTLLDCDPVTCAPQTEPVVCTDDGNLCTVESCVEGSGCESAPVMCGAGEECNPENGNCEPTVACPCFADVAAVQAQALHTAPPACGCSQDDPFFGDCDDSDLEESIRTAISDQTTTNGYCTSGNGVLSTAANTDQITSCLTGDVTYRCAAGQFFPFGGSLITFAITADEHAACRAIIIAAQAQLGCINGP